MKSRTYTYISRFISRLPREFMLRFPQTSVLNMCFSHVAPLQTPKGKANVRATKRPRQSQRATCAQPNGCAGPPALARSASRDASWQCITAPAASCYASSAALHALCSPSPTSLPLTRMEGGVHASLGRHGVRVMILQSIAILYL